MKSDLRTALRAATAPSHKHLDSMLAEVGPFASRENYARYLHATADLYTQFGAMLDRASDLIGLTRNSSTLAGNLADDLKNLGAPHADTLVSNVPADAEPHAISDSHLLGIGYTLEGSALGATQLVKQVRERLGADVPDAFLSSLAEGAKTRWPVLAEYLQQSTTNSIAEACEEADRVFQAAASVYRAHYRCSD